MYQYQYKKVSKCFHVIFSVNGQCKGQSRLSLPADITNFIQGDSTAQYSPLPTTTSPAPSGGDTTSDDSDDVPMLQMEDVNDHEGGWPIYLGMLNRENKTQCHGGSMLSIFFLFNLTI